MKDFTKEREAARARARQLLDEGFEPTEEELANARVISMALAAHGQEESEQEIAAVLRAIGESLVKKPAGTA